MKTRHVAVWIDHHEARVYAVHPETFETSRVEAPPGHAHRHESTTRERNHPADRQHFFRDVTRALVGAEEILVVGPAQAKLEFMTYVRENEKALAAKVVGVETVDHPTDKELVAHARKAFLAFDRMHPA